MKHILLSLLTIFAITLTACSFSSTNTQTGSTQTTNGITTETQLALGSLKLEDTEYAITREQATELLPMWQVYGDLLTSDTAAQEEIDALIEQIQETMTTDQMQTITQMGFTQQDVAAVVQASTVFTSTSQNDSSVTVPTGGGGQGGGGVGPADFAGGPPAGGGGADFGGAGGPAAGLQQSQNSQTSSGSVRISGIPSRASGGTDPGS